jgi:hypothetical protein
MLTFLDLAGAAVAWIAWRALHRTAPEPDPEPQPEPPTAASQD